VTISAVWFRAFAGSARDVLRAGAERMIRVPPGDWAWRLALSLLACVTPAQAWEAKPLAEIAVYPQRAAQAQVVSLNESRLAAELSARVVSLPVEPGQRIARGAVVARLDCRDYELAVEGARAAMQAAEARARLMALQHARAVKLAAEGFLSAEALDTRLAELDALRAEVAVSRASLETARAATGKCVIRAPFPAIVVERLAQEGEMATPGAPLARLFDTSRIEVRAEVRVADAPDLAAARDPRLVTPEGSYELRLISLSPAVTPSTRLMQARLRFSAAAAPPGSSGRVLWRSSLPYLPATLLTRRQGRLGVFVVAGDVPRFMPLADAQEGRPARAEGLRADSRVVVSGFGVLP